MSEDSVAAKRESREEWVRNDLTRRLKRTCEKLSDGDFAALVSDMTREQLRGERDR